MTYGEVKSVEDGKITIAVGTMKDMGGNGGAPEKPDENGSGDASADTSDAESTESDSKDAESDKTDSKDGDSTDNGEAPEKPDGDNEYSRAMKSHFRKFGNQMSGSGNHLCNYASLLA